MSHLDEYFDEYKMLKGLTTEKELAESLNFRPQEISRARSRGYVNTTQCLILAKELGISPAVIFLARECAKEKNQNTLPHWEQAYLATKRFLRTDNKDYRKLGTLNILAGFRQSVKFQPFIHNIFMY